MASLLTAADRRPGRRGAAVTVRSSAARPSPCCVSVVVPAYNEEAYLPACLDALARNVAQHVEEIIVVDNNSTDATMDIIARCPAATYAFEPDKGITRARQRGLDLATGDVVAYVDADTRPPPGWIDRLTRLFHDPGLAGVSGPYSFYDLDWLHGAAARGWFAAARPLHWLNGCLLVGGNFAIRRDVLVAMGGFDRSIEFYGEDVDIARRARRHGRIAFSPALVMPTSGRRMVRQGFARTAVTYLANYAAVMLRGHPLTSGYEDIR